MDDEKLIEEVRNLRGILESLLYAIWALGAIQNLRAQTGSQSQESMDVNLDSPEGRELALQAMKGFGSLAGFVMNESRKPDSAFRVPSPWKM
ncbi:MAG: hypothetical protein WCD04_17345 [Terriglobia bacterium]|jgi:hypothetical protein